MYIEYLFKYPQTHLVDFYRSTFEYGAWFYFNRSIINIWFHFAILLSAFSFQYLVIEKFPLNPLFHYSINLSKIITKYLKEQILISSDYAKKIANK